MLNLVGKELLPTSARWATVWLAVYSLMTTFWPPTKMAISGEIVSGLSSAGLPQLKPGWAWQDHEYLFVYNKWLFFYNVQLICLDQTKLRLDMSNSNSMILLSAPLGNEWCLTCRLKEMFRPFYFWLGSGVWQYQFLCFPVMKICRFGPKNAKNAKMLTWVC